jgi:hypothetical protein
MHWTFFIFIIYSPKHYPRNNFYSVLYNLIKMLLPFLDVIHAHVNKSV